MKTVLKNQTYNNSKTFIRYNDKSRVVTKQKKQMKQTQRYRNWRTFRKKNLK